MTRIKSKCSRAHAAVRFLFLALAVFAGAWSLAAVADRGSIPFKPQVQIFEPNQRAMIAWNEHEEILLLSTDLHASEPTKVLEVMPFPAQPQVKKGDVEVFKKATALINQKLNVQPKRRGILGEIDAVPPAAEPAGEVTFHEKIGAHDVSVTRVREPTQFVEWVEKYLRSNGVDNPTIPAEVKRAVAEYLRDGYEWFVFDVVELDKKPKTNEAIQYRFNTTSLFYPLRISRVGKGETTIDLLILTPHLLSKFPGFARERVILRHRPIAITSVELRGLNEEKDKLLGHREDMKLRIWQIKGSLASFDHDLIAE